MAMELEFAERDRKREQQHAKHPRKAEGRLTAEAMLGYRGRETKRQNLGPDGHHAYRSGVCQNILHWIQVYNSASTDTNSGGSQGKKGNGGR